MDKTSSAEKEFSLWLRRPNKTFQENLQFALNAWKSAEFTLSTKYEIILEWLTEAIGLVENPKDLPFSELRQLTEQRAHPGLIAHSVKLGLVNTLLEIGDKYGDSKSRNFPELLRSLSDLEVIQDIFRSDNEIQPRLQSSLLHQYELYLNQFSADEAKESKWNCEYEADFFATVLKAITESTKRAADMKEYANAYNAHVVQPLTEVILQLRAKKLLFFNDFLELERLISEEYTDNEFIKRMVGLPLHSQLLVMECGIANRRNVVSFMNPLLVHIFSDEHKEASLRLTIAAYTLEMLRKYDINLSFELNNASALEFIGNCIHDWVKSYKVTNFREVLMLLCATLRLNPLILEQHIFHITTWLMVAEKIQDDEQRLFEEYLILLIDMFRRLSQVEKFVGNLLKSLKQWLQNFELPAISNGGKRKSLTNQTLSPKKRRYETIEGATCINKPQKWTADKYLQILFCDFSKVNTEKQLASEMQKHESFPDLNTIWPSDTVGIAFTRLVSGLVSKPSLVIWKTLLYGVKELLEQLPNDAALSNNQLFQIDFYAALLSEYFNGCKLAEQYNIFSKQIDDLRALTASVLSQFGKYLLAREYNKRTMRAFLECIYSTICFEHILSYYRPDADEDVEQPLTPVKDMHSYLNDKEFSLLHQRVLNFGNAQCKFLLNRLQVQAIETKILYETPEENVVNVPTICLQQSGLTITLTQPKQLQMLMQSENAQWLECHLHNDEKLNMCKTLLQHDSFDKLVDVCSDDSKTLEFLTFSVYEQLQKAFAEIDKHSLLATNNFDFANLNNQSAKQFKQSVQLLMSSIKDSVEKEHHPKLPVEAIEDAFQKLKHLPISYIQRQSKLLVFTFQLALYCDLKASCEAELTAEALDILTDMLHLGPRIPVLKYVDCIVLQKLFPVQQHLAMYETLFIAIKNEEKGSESFLLQLEGVIQHSQEHSKLSNDERLLLLMAIESISSLSGASAKRMRKHLLALLHTYRSYVQEHFQQTNGEQPKKDKKFVSKTISGFAAYANIVLAQNALSVEQQFVLNDEFRRLFKIYIGYSLDYRDSHGVRLVQVALNHRQQLNFAQNEIEFTLSSYWKQLNLNIKETKSGTVLQDEKTAETVIKLIVAYKTNEDLLIMLKNIANMLSDMQFLSVIQLLTLIAKCPFSTVKGAIFIEQCKQILHIITMQLMRNEAQQYIDQQIVLGILACQLSIIENKMLTVSLDTMDGILSLLIDINIKNITVNESNLNYFTSLYTAMVEVCIALVKYRHLLLVDRVAQFMHIFKDLTRSIVWYKCDRENDSALTANELDKLAELAMKLESLMHLIVNHSVSFKRVSPFVLIFIINLVVAEKRTTTLYPNIKKHIDSVCYDLIGICDNRVGGFILRCLNEASRQVYEALVKNHNKYHKFKGKV